MNPDTNTHNESKLVNGMYYLRLLGLFAQSKGRKIAPLRFNEHSTQADLKHVSKHRVNGLDLDNSL